METNSNLNPSPNDSYNARPLLLPEIGSDGIARESPVIAYTEKIIEEEQLQLRKYIAENYSRIRDVERELSNLTMEMKLTAGPKKAALEHMRKKIEMSTERIHIAKLKESQAKQVWEAAAKTVKDEEAIKQKLCEDLNNLVQESSNSQFARLEELKRRLEALNPNRLSTNLTSGVDSGEPAQTSIIQDASEVQSTSKRAGGSVVNISNQGNFSNIPLTNCENQQSVIDGEGRGKKKSMFQGRLKGTGAIAKCRGPAAPGWTGAGFDVDGRS
ncbi:uncharacterized protein LOC111403904 [Olea europaea var. sylvestris]|uniref:RAB6-interacting golgin n=1 Tax=Olea europaea subsp. europaea TaxID=158383 RepID=A0A8S0PW30_OLEEU|nr:uncharacterized protein LOC111403904 [Olea europaea var. sylvestris]CAA2955807.1 Hypothetical predicted protein [Olea europaea subsp. europaea]